MLQNLTKNIAKISLVPILSLGLMNASPGAEAADPVIAVAGKTTLARAGGTAARRPAVQQRGVLGLYGLV